MESLCAHVSEKGHSSRDIPSLWLAAEVFETYLGHGEGANCSDLSRREQLGVMLPPSLHEGDSRLGEERERSRFLLSAQAQ